MKKLLILLIFMSNLAWTQVTNVTTGATYSTLQAAFTALPATFTEDVILEVTSDSLVSVTSTLSGKIILPYHLTLRGQTGKKPVIDAQGNNTTIYFNGANNSIGNITVSNLQIYNYNTVASGSKGLSWITVKGDNFVVDCTFRLGAVPMRYTTNCGNISMIRDSTFGHTFGSFRFGLGNANYTDLGIITIQDCYIQSATSGLVSTDDCFVLKSSPEVIITNNRIVGSGRTLIALESVAKSTIRRNILERSGLATNSSASIQVINISASKSRNCRVENNLCIQNRNGFFMDPH